MDNLYRLGIFALQTWLYFEPSISLSISSRLYPISASGVDQTYLVFPHVTWDWVQNSPEHKCTTYLYLSVASVQVFERASILHNEELVCQT